MEMSSKLVPVALAVALMVGGIGSAAANTESIVPQGAVMMADAEMDAVRGEAVSKKVKATKNIAKSGVIDYLKDEYMKRTMLTIFGVKIEVGPVFKTGNEPKFGFQNGYIPGTNPFKPNPTSY